MPPAVAELYRVFRQYRLPDDFSGCSDCVSPTDSAHLASMPLAKLTVSELDRYTFKAMTTWGTVDDFKHFLPRLLELAWDHYLEFENPETLMGKLAYAKWNSWPEPERLAVAGYLESFWRHQLNSPARFRFPDDERIHVVLSGLAEACTSLRPYLDLWASSRSKLSALHLAQLIDSTANDVMIKGKVSLWSSRETHSNELVTWLGSDAPSSILNPFRDTIDAVFPYVRRQLEGIRAAVARYTPAK